VIIDVHGHTLDLAYHRGLPLHGSLGGATDVPLMRRGGVTAQLCATWTPNAALSGPHRYSVRDPLAALLGMLDYLDRELTGPAGGEVLLARTCADLRAAEASGRVALIVGMEGTDALCGDVAVLRTLHGRGLRHVCLVHEHGNEFGTASQVWEHGRMRRHDPARDPALRATEAGRALIAEMNRLGVLVDLTHLVEPAFWEALALVEGPVVISHGGVRRSTDSIRYPSDAQIRAVARTGGLVGASPAPLGPSEEHAGLELLLDTVDALVSLVGVEHVGIGTDFLDETGYDPAGFADIGEMPRVTRGLRDRGYDPASIERILGGNFQRVFERVADAKAVTDLPATSGDRRDTTGVPDGAAAGGI
jgi:membrane dipeptidase